MAYTNKRYTKVQLVAYHTPTFLASAVKTPKALVPVPPCIGRLQNDDEKFRVTRMYEVVMWAANQNHVDKASTTLKLFVAPEFYFKTVQANSKNVVGLGGSGQLRSAGGFGAYSFNTMMNIMSTMREIFQDPFVAYNLQHWLLVPGTIVSDLPMGTHYGQDSMYLNTAVIIKGDKEGPFHYLQKHYVSNIDGPPTDNGIYSSTKQTPYADILKKLKAKGIDEDSKRMFQIDNIKFAVEVCKDHDQGVAKSAGGSNVDIHLVTACGMSLIPQNIVAKKNGYAMICDGTRNFMFPRSDAKKVMIAGGKNTNAIVDLSKWDCSSDTSGNQGNRWRAAEPVLLDKSVKRAAVPKDLCVSPLDSAVSYGDGQAQHTYTPEEIRTYEMFPEEIVWYPSVAL